MVFRVVAGGVQATQGGQAHFGRAEVGVATTTAAQDGRSGDLAGRLHGPVTVAGEQRAHGDGADEATHASRVEPADAEAEGVERRVAVEH
ncbi:MAG: hypothetical protein R3F17_15040 [Planctomycetota bacterium]